MPGKKKSKRAPRRSEKPRNRPAGGQVRSAERPDRLTEKERRFVEAYMGEAQGNGTLACKLAGYKGTDAVLAQTAYRLLRKAEVRAAVDRRVDSDPKVANREARQRFWTETMRDAKVAMKDRLKASELLGKSQADFVDRHQIETSDGAQVVLYLPDNGRGAVPGSQAALAPQAEATNGSAG